TVLTIKNVRYVFIRKKGRPYLIRKGDTLKSIAAKVYGNSKNWKKIWKNNPQLIKNPKKLYAGFTLYYETASGEPTKIRKPTSSQ
ncbi:MAG: LysM peptidoglycan-binding domain-containing protein, partial [Bdellovibrionales bacterium]|nr:LysM peptidoglycan-binding domain-containing protein [Bdellovibrionales bacterium]